MGRKIKGLLIISAIITILISFFLTLYYCVFNKEHTGPMDWWAIILLAIPAVVCIVSRILIEETLYIEVDESFKGKSLWGKIGVLVNRIAMGVSTVLALPIGIIFLIISLPLSCFTAPGKRSFKKLIAKGFEYKFENKMYILTRNEIVIRIHANFIEYYISFDYGKSFVRVEESDLGLPSDRDVLKAKLHEYKNAHPVDVQRGDALPPISEFVDFLDHNLNTYQQTKI